ncbi:PaaI family thioesterase [Brevibacillus fluminis]|uniref:PaaI family thioesterase n=1 Tax=Brevibacillus fluminis TaxID=511487 RepID=A0A3M8DIH7_9BACL|nr:PaaI family thioesterase [Brevibacillus fluminis]RNB87399.1 PaaI family thioesterase [Brevibacillus fluminis]
MIEELSEVVENGEEDEKALLAIALQAIRQKRERNSSLLSGMLGLQGRFIDEKTYQFIVPITPFMYNSLGIVHGGMTATILDSVMGSMVNRSLPQGQYAVTTDLKTNYIRGAKTGNLRAEATILHRGRTLAVVTGSIYDDRDRLIAHGTGTFMVLGSPQD